MGATTNLQQDLREYLDILWRGKGLIIGGTIACLVIMAAYTWAVPRLFLIRTQIDAGTIAVLEPSELNLLLEAVERDEFRVEGGRFTETAPKALTVAFNAPSTIRLQALTTHPASGFQRLMVLAPAVVKELNRRLALHQRQRDRADENARTVRADAIKSLQWLTRVVDQRSAWASAAALAARTDAERLAARRSQAQLMAVVRLRRILAAMRARLQLLESEQHPSSAAVNRRREAGDAVVALEDVLETMRLDLDPTQRDNLFAVLERSDKFTRAIDRLSFVTEPALAYLPAMFREIASYDMDIARAVDAQRMAERVIHEDERALSLLSSRSSFPAAAAATEMQKTLDDMGKLYAQDDTTTPAIEKTKTRFQELAGAYRTLDAIREEPATLRPASIVIPPALPARPAWPRPLVNLAIALLFGFFGSSVAVAFLAQARRTSLTGASVQAL